jgi:hypothetical protein
MRVPQVTDRLKEAPAQALRAVFSGVGQVLLVADRLRHRQDQGEANGHSAAPAAPSAPPAPPAPAEPPVPSAPASPPASAAPVTPLASEEPPATAAPPVPAPAAAAGTGAGGGLPLEGYDGLTVPQLRARMRTLDPVQLRALVAHEQAHAGRDEVVAMFERRIAKVESGG